MDGKHYYGTVKNNSIVKLCLVLWIMNQVRSHESRISIMSHFNHIATSDIEQSKTKVFVTLR